MNNLIPATDPPSEDEIGDFSNAVYIPEFVSNANIDDSTDFESLNKEWQKVSWMTPGLSEELKQCFPCHDKIDRDNNNKRNFDSFKEKVSKVFYIGREFASYKQFVQAASEVMPK